MKERKQKKCQCCKEPFYPHTTLQKYCSPACQIVGGDKVRKKKAREKKKPDELAMKKWAIEVKERADYKCEYCGAIKYLNSHHIFSRRNKSVRFDVDNGCCLCSKHHVFSLEFSAHKAPMEFSEWIKEKRGVEWYERLRQKALQIIP